MQRPIRTTRIEMPEPYEGWSATIQTNITMGVYDRLVGSDWEQKLGALVETVREWNFVDDAGEPVELVVTTVKNALGFDQIKLLIAEIDQEIGRFLRELSTSD